MNPKKIAVWTGAALLAFFLISQPHESAALVEKIVTDLAHGAGSVITFVSSIFG